jgi:hypothetical protein
MAFKDHTKIKLKKRFIKKQFDIELSYGKVSIVRPNNGLTKQTIKNKRKKKLCLQKHM